MDLFDIFGQGKSAETPLENIPGEVFRGDLPTARKYSVIYADPSWHYRDKALAGDRGAGCKYPVQSDEWVASLPVGDLATEDAFLFLWITFPKLPVAFKVMEAWGFTYKTVAFNWVKKNKKSDSWFWGLGHYTRSNSEICLLATRGKPKRVSASVHSVVDSRIEEHSKKPAIVRERIVKLCGDLSRIELFARQRAPGWDAWGNEV